MFRSLIEDMSKSLSEVNGSTNKQWNEMMKKVPDIKS